MANFMQIGRFFSLKQGRVGQYLSPRVLLVRTPFRRAVQGQPDEFCCFGFSSFRQAQKFGQSLARMNVFYELRSSRLMPEWAYEVVVRETQLARTLAYWNRHLDGVQPTVRPATSRTQAPIAA